LPWPVLIFAGSFFVPRILLSVEVEKSRNSSLPEKEEFSDGKRSLLSVLATVLDMSDPTPVAYREDYADMTADEITAQVDHLQAGMRSHPDYVAHDEWTALQRSLDVFRGNATELMVLLVTSETDENLRSQLTFTQQSPHVREAFFRALDRSLHNALASAVSLVDHTRRLVDNYPASAFASEFGQKNTAVKEEPGAEFLRRFRNYLLHIGHAPFGMTTTFATEDRDAGTLSIYLDSATLLKAKGFWSGPSRAFVAGHPDGIHLREVAQDYITAIGNLYAWVFQQEERLHPNGIETINGFVERINLTMSRGSLDGRNQQAWLKHVGENVQAQREGRPQTDWREVNPSKRKPPRETPT
jgi:hypothetical protein